ncbi:MAG: coproporphyrinogen III oxidase [Bdellovibrionota bacterium]
MKSTQERIEGFLQKYPLISMNEMLTHELSDPSCQDPIWKTIQNENGNFPFSKNLIQLFLYLRNLNKTLFNTIEGKEACTQKYWNAQIQHPDKKLNGGGVMTVIREQILEKSAVNMSIVHGPQYPAMEGEYAGKPFVAGGVSLISHPKNPNAPIMHLNVRCIQITENNKVTKWIGGGADLTPMVIFNEDTNLFHEHMKKACENHPHVGNYEKYKKWADEYFYIPHRKEIRGVGGIFFDFVPLESEENFAYLLDVGQHATHAYAKIMSQRTSIPYDETLSEKHLYWRSRYAEFNLAYDRGTRFGLLSGGNSEAILCSMPPTVKW